MARARLPARREVVASLIDEYKASESPDYIQWGLQEEERAVHERMAGESGAIEAR